MVGWACAVVESSRGRRFADGGGGADDGAVFAVRIAAGAAAWAAAAAHGAVRSGGLVCLRAVAGAAGWTIAGVRGCRVIWAEWNAGVVRAWADYAGGVFAVDYTRSGAGAKGAVSVGGGAWNRVEFSGRVSGDGGDKFAVCGGLDGMAVVAGSSAAELCGESRDRGGRGAVGCGACDLAVCGGDAAGIFGRTWRRGGWWVARGESRAAAVSL